MKKHLIATAVAAAVSVPAVAQVTVYGNLDMSYTETQNKVTAANGTLTSDRKIKNTGNGDGALSTSVIGFRGAEDLGGGLKAHFHLEYDLVDVGTGANGNGPISGTAADTATNTNRSVASADSVNGFGARLSYIGVDGAFGTVRLGRQAQSVHGVIAAGLAGGGNNVAGQAYSSGMNGALNSAAIRAQDVYVNRAITYISPKLSGLQIELQHGEHQHSGTGEHTTKAKQTGGSISYEAGKLKVAVGMSNTDTDAGTTTVASNDVLGLSASYNFGMATVFGMRQEREIKDVDAGTLTSDTTANQIGVRMPFGSTTVWASAFDGERKETNAGTKSDVGGYQLGAVYAFSKRTSAYAIYGTQEIKATTTSAKTESDGLAIGLRHSF